MKRIIFSLVGVLIMLAIALPSSLPLVMGVAGNNQTATNETSLETSLVADFDFNIPECPLCEGVAFTDQSTGGMGRYKYHWDFGDGGSSRKKNPTHYYTSYGAYNVTLTVTDRADNVDSESKTVTLGSTTKAIELDSGISLTGLVAPPSGWPTAANWTHPTVCYCDPQGDQNPKELDLIGCYNDGTYDIGPAVFYYFDTVNGYAYFRERVRGDPSGTGIFGQKAWVVLFDLPAPGNYEYLVGIDGLHEKVQLWENTVKASLVWNPILKDGAEVIHWEGSTATYARILPDGTGHYFVDWAIPLTELTSRNIGAGTIMYFATSADANNYNKDYLGCYIPDLTVTEKSEAWVSLANGTYNVTYTVCNTGAAPAVASHTAISIDTVLIMEDESVPALIPGQCYTNTVGPFTMSPTSDTIQVCADYDNVVTEGDETNNCLENTFQCTPPVADFNATPTFCCAPLEVNFTNQSTGNPTSWAWDFGDNTTSTLQNPSHTYTDPGIYTVSLNVTNACGSDIKTEDNYITVGGPPTANFTADKTSCCAPLTVNFTDTSDPNNKPISWGWDFGDNTTGTLQNPSHTYTVPGIYTVSLNVTNACGSDTETKDDYIKVGGPPTANFTADPTSCCAPLTVNFTDTSDPNNKTISWAWDFGDNTTSTLQDPSHTYTDPGIYTVSLNVTNLCGSDTKTEENYIKVGGPPTADFEADPTSGCAPLTVNFTDTSDPNNKTISWAWDFGDGSNSTAQSPSHQYDNAGTYNVTLTVTNACGEGTETRYITARDCPPPVPPTGGGCPSTKYLTVDWEGNNTTEPLYSNDKLAVDLIGPSPDLSHSLLLERGTHAPVVGRSTYYLIVIRELEEIPPPPENTVALVAFDITPPGAEFDRDIFLTLGLDQSQLPENALNVTMAYYDDVNDVWVFLESEAGGPNGVAELTLSAPINHFSIFGVLAELEPTPPPQPAHFVASGLSIEPSVERIWEPVTFVTKTGESVTITANVANDGWQEGTYTVELKLNGVTVDTKMVTVGAGQSKPVSFTRAGLDYGQYEVEVAGLSGEFTTSRTITWWLILVIIAAIGLIIWGVVWGRRRRRARQQA